MLRYEDFFFPSQSKGKSQIHGVVLGKARTKTFANGPKGEK
jgi:hypothetical protein